MDPTLSILAQTDATLPEDIYDIVVPPPETELWPLLLSLVLALLIVAGAVWLVRHLLRHREPPAAPPQDRALRAFDRIERQQDELAPNRFALAVSDALKDYFAERFRDPVRYETTEEFLARLSREGTRLPSAAQQDLRDFLAASEEIKFGNRPDASDRTRPLLKRARNLVGLCESVNARTK